MLKTVEGELCLLEVLEVMRCVLGTRMLEAVEGRLFFGVSKFPFQQFSLVA